MHHYHEYGNPHVEGVNCSHCGKALMYANPPQWNGNPVHQLCLGLLQQSVEEGNRVEAQWVAYEKKKGKL